jgi:hypothetical protein
VSQVSNNPGHTSKTNAKDYCAKEKHARQQATSGTRVEYNGRGDEETMRTDTFTFDGGHLVKIDMVYLASTVNLEGYRPKCLAISSPDCGKPMGRHRKARANPC